MSCFLTCQRSFCRIQWKNCPYPLVLAARNQPVSFRHVGEAGNHRAMIRADLLGSILLRGSGPRPDVDPAVHEKVSELCEEGRQSDRVGLTSCPRHRSRSEGVQSQEVSQERSRLQTCAVADRPFSRPGASRSALRKSISRASFRKVGKFGRRTAAGSRLYKTT